MRTRRLGRCLREIAAQALESIDFRRPNLHGLI